MYFRTTVFCKGKSLSGISLAALRLEGVTAPGIHRTKISMILTIADVVTISGSTTVSYDKDFFQ